MIYKVSYVIIRSPHPGAILNQETPPQVGERVRIGEVWCEIVEVQDLLPPQGEYAYLHVTCRPVEEDDAEN